MSRPVLLVALVAAALSAACSSDGGGAIVLRWQLVDSATGGEPDACSGEAGSGCCGLVQTRDRLRKSVCIDEMRLSVVRGDSDGGGGDGGAPAGFVCATCRFACGPREHATAFELPPGDYRVALEPLRKGRPIGLTPPALARSVRRGEVTNLKSIEILLDADQAACAE